jgi:hypothetical protein
MANLGAFAGGMAKGIQTQQDYNLRKQEAEEARQLRQQQIEMQQARHGREKKQWAEEDESAIKRQELHQKWLGEREEDEVDPASGQPTGRKRKIPAWSPNDTGPEATARMLGMMKDSLAYSMGRVKDPKQLAEMVEFVRKHEGSEAGRKVMAMASGDPQATADFVKSMGGIPEKARFIREKMALDLGNGKTIDVRSHLYSIGAYEAAQALSQQHTQARQDKLAEGELALLPLKGNLLRAQAERQRAAAANGGTGSAGKLGQQSVKEYTALSKTNPLVDPVPGADGKRSAWSEAEAFRLARFAEHRPGTKDATGAWSKANSEFQALNKLAEAEAKRLFDKGDKKSIAKAYGSSSPASVKKAIFDKLIQKNFPNLQAPAIPSADTEDIE